MKEHAKVLTVVNKSNIRTPKPDEKIKVEPSIDMVKDLHYKKYVNLWPSVSDPRRIGHKFMTILDQLVKSCSGGSKP